MIQSFGWMSETYLWVNCMKNTFRKPYYLFHSFTFCTDFFEVFFSSFILNIGNWIRIVSLFFVGEVFPCVPHEVCVCKCVCTTCLRLTCTFYDRFSISLWNESNEYGNVIRRHLICCVYFHRFFVWSTRSRNKFFFWR